MPRTSLYAGTLQPREFEAAVRRVPRLLAQSAAAARAVLVDGRALEDVAQQTGLTRQRIHAIAARVHAAAVPADWETFVVALPPSVARHVRRLQEEEMRRWHAQLQARSGQDK